MRFRDYIKKAKRTASSDVLKILVRINTKKSITLLHCVMGLCTESAELLDAVKKYIFYGKDIDIKNIKEELGDIMWYFALICDEMNFDFYDILNCNISKLEKRYPSGFSKNDAINRDTEKELEGF